MHSPAHITALEAAQSVETFASIERLPLSRRHFGRNAFGAAAAVAASTLVASPALAQNDTIAVARSLIDAFNKRDLGAWEKRLADDFAAQYPGAPTLGREQARGFNAIFLDAFPDMRWEINKAFVNGDTAAFDTTAFGTHTAPLVLPTGVVPPTGRKGVVPIALVVQVRDGRIKSEKTFWNQADLFAQLGLMK